MDNEDYFPILTCQSKGLATQVYDIVMEQFATRTEAEWRPILKAADIPFSLCQNWIEIRNDKQAEANNCFYDMKYANGNVRRLVRLPVKFQEMGVPEYKAGPLIGENGPEILRELGYDDEQIQKMLDEGALFVWKDE